MQEPITGVRGSDAVAFVQWVNGITGSDTVYRLPNLAEINDSALHRALTTPTPGIPPQSIWLKPDNEHDQPELWTPAGTDHPHLVGAATLASHVKNDIKRSTPTLIRLLLLQSIIAIHGFAGDLHRGRALDFARALDRGLSLALDRDLARTSALDLVRTYDLDLELELALDLDLDRALDLDLARALDLARDRENFHARVMGNALTHALARVLHRNTPTATWPAEFAQEFVDETGLAKADYVVSPDTLADKIHNGHQAMVNLLGPPDEAASLPWAHQVARNLQETALPVFTRQQPLTTDTATEIRLAALCLAAEADAREANQLGDTFREIAAGVTLLERRATGQAVPTETIMLAVT